MEILLDSKRNKEARNEPISLDINLDTVQKTMSGAENISSTLSLLQLYKDEADNCNKYRLIVTINPVCTNALFNVKTEIVKDEGSDNVKCLNFEPYLPDTSKCLNKKQEINVQDALDDTEYSSPDTENLVYHCGADIFSNHHLRNTGFQFFKKPKDNGNTWYNTISSKLTNNEGKVITMPLELSSVTRQNVQLNELHAYNLENLMTFKSSYHENLREEDGWYGFYNSGNIKIDNNEEGLNVNRVLNNEPQCGFIDMYPDRSLFSFIPKFNGYRDRMEKNWDYCLTYPYKADAEMLHTVGASTDDGFLKIYKCESGKTGGGGYMVRFWSKINTNLKPNDKILLRVNDTERICRVGSVGDENGKDIQHIFNVRFSDIYSAYDYEMVEGKPEMVGLVSDYEYAFKKVSNGLECSYYFRKFKKIKPEGYRNDINKVACGLNIYGDRIAQIIFTDDIITEGNLTDSMGFPVSDIYLTFIKRNRGHNEWYSGDITSDSVEYSHCFGKVTSGIRIDGNDGDYDIRRINNVFGHDYNNLYSVIEDDITDDMDEFYGDIVEYDPTLVKETILEHVFHRFNTEQRELKSEIFSSITFNDIISDDLMPKIDGTGLVGFSTGVTSIEGTIKNGININPEGYYYCPNYAIKLRDLSSIKSVKVRMETNKGVEVLETEIDGVYTMVGPIQWSNLKAGEELVLYDNTHEHSERVMFSGYSDGNGKVEGTIDTSYTYTYVYSISDGCPVYSKLNPNNRTMIWRDVIPYSELSNDSPVYNTPFSNGAFYKHVNLNFFLMRQDPDGSIGLRGWSAMENPNAGTFTIEWNKRLDLSEVEYFYNDLNFICF